MAKATLEVELEGDALAGALSTPDSAPRPFAGWIELAVVIEDWRDSARVADAAKGEVRCEE
jgi:hypothetical protein